MPGPSAIVSRNDPAEQDNVVLYAGPHAAA
jgi:hypothetical protein